MMWPCGATLIRWPCCAPVAVVTFLEERLHVEFTDRPFLGTICRPARSGIHFQRLLDIRRFAFGRVASSAVGVRDFLFLFCFSFFTLLVFVSLCAFWICRWVSQQPVSLLHERCLASPPFWVIRARALGDVARLATVCQSNAQFSLMMSHRTLVANARSEYVLREFGEVRQAEPLGSPSHKISTSTGKKSLCLNGIPFT